MFTGLIEEIGQVKRIKKGSQSAQITISASKVLQDIKLGDSISTNGVCLTVTDYNSNSFTVDVMPETMRRSNLKNISTGCKVNLERALRLGDRLGGHIVSGHIDGTGNITDIKEEENATWVTIHTCPQILRYIVKKGSIAIDGISLTVANVNNSFFKVSIIPLTKNDTTIVSKKIGDEVNIECDIFSKYIEKFSINNYEQSSSNKVDLNFLKENGFA